MNETVSRRPTHVWADPVPGGRVALAAVTDGGGSCVVYLTPAAAAKLGHMLIGAAESVELPGPPL
jgi:hypothetical protein